jgi:hypothetical protein
MKNIKNSTIQITALIPTTLESKTKSVREKKRVFPASLLRECCEHRPYRKKKNEEGRHPEDEKSVPHVVPDRHLCECVPFFNIQLFFINTT